MFFRIEEQTGAKAQPVFVAGEDVEIPAALTAFPEFGIVGEFGERHRPETEFVIHFHYRRTGGYRENLRVREKLAGEDESLLLDAFRKPDATESVCYDEAGIGDERLSSPAFNVGKTGEFTVLGYGYDSLAGKHLLLDVFRCTFCYAGLTFK